MEMSILNEKIQESNYQDYIHKIHMSIKLLTSEIHKWNQRNDLAMENQLVSVEDPDKNPNTHMVPNNDFQLRLDCVLTFLIFYSEMSAGKWNHHCRMKLDPYFSPCTNLTSKQINDFSVNPETLKLLGESIGSTLQNMDARKDFFNQISVTQEFRCTIYKQDLIRLNVSIQ